MANFCYMLSGMSPDWSLLDGLYVWILLIVIPFAIICALEAVWRGVAAVAGAVSRAAERRRRRKSRGNYWEVR